MLAAIVEALWMVLGRLEGGIGVVHTKSTKKASDRGVYPRPEWLHRNTIAESAGDDGVIVVHNVGAAIRMMKGGGDGS